MTTDTPSIRPRRRGFIWLVLGLVVAAAVLWALIGRPWEARPVEVPVETVMPGPATRVLAVNGHITPKHQVDISSTVSGRILAVAASEGDAFNPEEVLATLDSEQQRAAVAQASAALDGARATLNQAQVNYDRALALGENISRRDLDTQKLALQTAHDDVKRLTAARDQAQSLLGQYEVRAPFGGTVLIRAVDPGQVVAPSTVLFTFADLVRLEAEASVDEIYSADVRRGLAARLQPSGHNAVLDGTVDFVAPKVDTTTGGRLVRVAINDLAGLQLPIGLTVNINIVVEEVAEAVTVPRVAIVTEGNASFVYIVEGGAAVRRTVEYVDWPAERLIVTSGLAAGDVVIIDPGEVSEGDRVAAQG